jgi:hypothetical protein
MTSLREANQAKEVEKAEGVTQVNQVDQVDPVDQIQTAQDTPDQMAPARISAKADQVEVAMDQVDLEAMDHGDQEVVDQVIQVTMDQTGTTVMVAIAFMMILKTLALTATASEISTAGTRGTMTCTTQ